MKVSLNEDKLNIIMLCIRQGYQRHARGLDKVVMINNMYRSLMAEARQDKQESHTVCTICGNATEIKLAKGLMVLIDQNPYYKPYSEFVEVEWTVDERDMLLKMLKDEDMSWLLHQGLIVEQLAQELESTSVEDAIS